METPTTTEAHHLTPRSNLMAWYSVTCPTCGGERREQLYGPHKSREYALDHGDWTCESCKTQKRQADNKAAAQANTDAGLPLLEGSEKQIAWAETIRKSTIEQIGKLLKGNLPGTPWSPDTEKNRLIDLARLVDDPKNLSVRWRRSADVLVQQLGGRERLQQYIDHWDEVVERAAQSIRQQTSASWWIDHRNASCADLLAEALKKTCPPDEQVEQDAQKAEQASLEIAAQAEATLRPPDAKTKNVAEIRITDDQVLVEFPERRDDLYELLRRKTGYTWVGSERHYARTIEYTSGPIVDRAAEIGHKILALGIPVRIYDREIRSKAAEGDWMPESTRWIVARRDEQYGGWLGLRWSRKDDFYKQARRLRGSKWDNPHVVVPPEEWDEVLDFAERYDFRLTPPAEKIVAQAQSVKEQSLVVDVNAVEEEAPIKPSIKPTKLDIPMAVDVDEDLKDDPQD